MKTGTQTIMCKGVKEIGIDDDDCMDMDVLCRTDDEEEFRFRDEGTLMAWIGQVDYILDHRMHDYLVHKKFRIDARTMCWRARRDLWEWSACVCTFLTEWGWELVPQELKRSIYYMEERVGVSLTERRE